MARHITNSLFNSLRGRIWISTSVLAFFICTFGLISYLVVSLLVNDLFYGIFIPFLFLAFIVVVFGWWLSSEIVSPIEKVTLLAKSLERNSATTLPKTSGSYETDQLLHTLFRTSQQMQILVTLMDKVSSGNVDVSLSELEGSDRVAGSFQKLLGKVSESINAKEELESLRDSVDQLKRDVFPIRSGNLSVSVSTSHPETKEISSAVVYLVEKLSSIVTLVRSDASRARETAKEINQALQRIVVQDESRIGEMNQASITLKQVPNMVQEISESLSSSSASAKQSIEKAHQGSEIANLNSSSISQLRKQVREAVKRIQSLIERSQEIDRVAEAVEDLANRTNMIALNASIQATELGEKGHGFVLVAEEIERLATRANSTNRQIAALNKNLSTEVRKVENSLEITAAEISELSKFGIETANVLAELERYVGQFLNLQENLLSVSGDKAEATDQAFLTFLNSITEHEVSVEEMKASSAEAARLGSMMRELQLSVAEFRLGYQDEQSEIEQQKALPEPLEVRETKAEEPPVLNKMSETAPKMPADDEPEDELDIGKYYGKGGAAAPPGDDDSILEVLN